MNEQGHGLRVGQVWADNDPRVREFHGKERHLKIVDVYPNGALCEVVQHGNEKQIGRRTVILAKRFRPTKTGYRLLQDSDDRTNTSESTTEA